MKLFFLFASTIVLSLVVKAQDTILFRNGERAIVKLTEVNPDDIRYKRFDYSEGPIFTVLKQDVATVIYKNGVKDSFESYIHSPNVQTSFKLPDLSIQSSGKYYYYKELRISEPDMLAVAWRKGEPKIDLMIRKTEQKKFVQNAATITAISLFVSGAYIYETNRPKKTKPGHTPVNNSMRLSAQQNGKSLMLAALGCEAVAVYFMFDRRRHAKLVMNAYNATLIGAH